MFYFAALWNSSQQELFQPALHRRQNQLEMLLSLRLWYATSIDWGDVIFQNKAVHKGFMVKTPIISRKLLHWHNLVQRQSFVDLLVPSVKNYTGTNYTDKDIGVAFYNHYIAGWGNRTQQVSLKLIGK